MSVGYNPLAVREGLLFNLDFRNPKRFTGSIGTNLVQFPNYDASKWSLIFSTHASITTGIDAPDGSKTAVRLTNFGTGNALLRVAFNSFTPNGTDTYTASFWVRKVSGTYVSGNQITCDLNDGNPSGDYLPYLQTGKWVQVSFSAVATATAKTVFDLQSDRTSDYVLDFWGLKIENQTSDNTPTPLVDTIGRNEINFYRPQYLSFDSDGATFTRTASAPKWGGVGYKTMTGNLTSQNFLYNDHTWEIWFKINDRNPGAYDGTEGYSIITAYRGYHAGYMYQAGTLYYNVWDNTGTALVSPCYWTLGTSGTQIIQGSWHQVVVTRENDTFTPYVDGVQLGTGSTRSFTAFNGTSNDLFFGGSAKAAAGASSYVNYSKATLAISKMYNRALTSSEIQQNFNALRGRFGI